MHETRQNMVFCILKQALVADYFTSSVSTCRCLISALKIRIGDMLDDCLNGPFFTNTWILFQIIMIIMDTKFR